MTSEKTGFDVIILGAGPAGLSAALWCSELGLRAILLERENEPGGQLLWTFNAIKNHLGIEAADGLELRDIFMRQLDGRDVTLRSGSKVWGVDLRERSVELDDGSRYSARAMILATGVSRRKLGIPGESEYLGRGIIASGQTAKDEILAKRVAIVGGGDAALENALILSETAERVFVIHRRDETRARAEFVGPCRADDKIDLILNTELTAIVGNEHVAAVELRNVETGDVSTLPVDAVLIRVGEVPNTALFVGQIVTDDAGYLVVDHLCATDMENVFAVGDVVNPTAPTISSAVGMGATASRAIAAICRRQNIEIVQ